MAKRKATLAPEEARCYAAIGELTKKRRGIPPTYKELAHFMGKSSPGSVVRLLDRLEMKGHLTRDKNGPRSLQLI